MRNIIDMYDDWWAYICSQVGIEDKALFWAELCDAGAQSYSSQIQVFCKSLFE